MSRVQLTAWEQHKRDWGGCTRCELRDGRRSVVLARGKIPCDVLFVGEAPGESEDVLGSPFKGPAGKLLDSIVEEALDGAMIDGRPVRVAFTNMVCCIPRDPDGGKAGEPPDEALWACKPRLEEFVRLARPRLIVACGKVAEVGFTPGYQVSVAMPKSVKKVVSILHPAAILRANVVEQGLKRQRCVVQIANAMEGL